MKLTLIKSNMTEIEISRRKVLFSYEIPVAILNLGSGVFRRTTKKWSQTTARHINQWLTQTLPRNGYICYEGSPEDQSYFDNLLDKEDTKCQEHS